MSTATSILAQARAAGIASSLPYAGAVTPAEAWALLTEDPQIRLVDVRTNAERDWVGKVAISPVQHLATQWSLYPGAQPNPNFLEELSAQTEREPILLFLCRSGVRSRHAATLATQAGFGNCFDILEGFEGDRDATGHRKTVAGWCHAGLPWIGA